MAYSRLQRLLDRVLATAMGELRVRISFEDETPLVVHVGSVEGRPRGEQICRIVAELGPSCPGLIQIRHPAPRRWKIRVSGKLGGTGFDQRLRNVLGNL